jgi:hypothetical protein
MAQADLYHTSALPHSSLAMPSTFIKTFDTLTFKGTISVPLGLYINGEFVDPVEGGTLE